MNDTQTLAHPAVEAFVEEVRARLGDLTDEQREELLDGLAADLTEQLADGADGVLDDPVGYAAELRSAAGLPEPRRTLPRLQVPTPQRVEATLDRVRAAWLTRVGDSRVVGGRRSAASGVVGGPRLDRGHPARPGDGAVGAGEHRAVVRLPAARRRHPGRRRGGQRAHRPRPDLARLRRQPLAARATDAHRAQRAGDAGPAGFRHQQPRLPVGHAERVRGLRAGLRRRDPLRRPRGPAQQRGSRAQHLRLRHRRATSRRRAALRPGRAAARAVGASGRAGSTMAAARWAVPGSTGPARSTTSSRWPSGCSSTGPACGTKAPAAWARSSCPPRRWRRCLRLPCPRVSRSRRSPSACPATRADKDKGDRQGS